jgi:hypothetical protein
MRLEMARMRKRAGEVETKMAEELDRLRKSVGGELVPYGAYEPEKMLGALGSTRIPIKRAPGRTS